MTIRLFTLALIMSAVAVPVAAQPVVSVSSSVTLTIDPTGDFERRVITYDCDSIEPLTVEYLNAAPNFLAILPVNDDTLIFSAVLSGSGARYASGSWVWWTSGPEASLYDLTQGEDADPVAECFEFSLTP